MPVMSIAEFEKLPPAGDRMSIDDFEKKAPATSFGSKLKSAAAGYGQGGTFGLGDEIGGTLGAGLHAAFIDDPREFGDIRKEYVNESRAENEALRRANPKSYLGGEVAGAIVPTLTTSGAAADTALGRAGVSAAERFGAGRIGSAVIQGAVKGAPVGALFGYGTSEGGTLDDPGQVALDTAKGGLLGGVSGGVIQGGIETARPVVRAAARGLGKIGDTLKGYAEELRKPPPVSADRTAGVVKDINKKIASLEQTQAVPEAKILKDLSQNVGTEEGVAMRKSALMSPLTREEKNAGFFNNTKTVYHRIQDDFRNFEENIRFPEAAKNLKDIPAEQAKEPVMSALLNAKQKVYDMSQEGNELLYDQSAVKYLDKFSDDLAEKVSSAETSFDVYKALNEAKKQVASLARYGSDVGPKERGTIAEIAGIEKQMTGLLEDPRIFGPQAERHAAINGSYKKFLASLENMQNKFTQAEASETGRPISELSSTSVGTYSRQLDTVHGIDRRRFLDEMIQNAKDLSGTIEESALGAGQKPPDTQQFIENYLKEKNQFTNEMTLSNQLRRLRSNQGAENLGQPSGVRVAAEKIASSNIPHYEQISGLLKSGLEGQDTTNSILQKLVNKETQARPLERVATKAAASISDGIGNKLRAAPEFFGKFAQTLQQAAQRGAAALAATNHVLAQQSAEYRNMQRNINGEKPIEGEK